MSKYLFSDTTYEVLIDELRQVAEWSPNRLIEVQESPLERERQLGRELRQAFRIKQQDINDTENYLKQAEGFTSEANEQAIRLNAVNAFSDSGIDHAVCPLCDSKLDVPTPSIQDLTYALSRIKQNVASVQQERPHVQNYLTKQKDELQAIRQEIRSTDQRLQALITEQETATRLRDTNYQAAWTSGRVSLYLDNLSVINPDSNIKAHASKLITLINDLEQQLAYEQIEDILTSILNVIGAKMTIRASKLQLEHAANSQYRLDIKKLTVIADTPDRPVNMDRMGSGENWLGCHLITFLSLHEYFINKNRPVPNFLILDQPSQVYFPSEVAYKALDGKSQNLGNAGADVLAVQRMFDLLFEAVEMLNNQFQIIVIEHANLNDQRFQDALVEDPWTEGSALIPESWLVE